MGQENSSLSSDFEVAREIALKLQAQPPTATPAPDADADPGYIEFGLPQPAPPSAATAPSTTIDAADVAVAPPALGADSEGGFGTENWHRLLDWCLEAVGADTAFVVDSHGLAIAARGQTPADDLEAVGNRLIIAFEQAHRMDVERGAESMVIQFGDRWLSGIAVRDDDAQVVTIGILGPRPAATGVCRAVDETVCRMIGIQPAQV